MKMQAVVPGSCGGLGSEAQGVQDRVHEGTGAISGEWAACTVGAVGSGSEAKDQDAGIWVAEAGDRARPVDTVLVGAATCFAKGNTVETQTWATFTIYDGLVSELERQRK